MIGLRFKVAAVAAVMTFAAVGSAYASAGWTTGGVNARSGPGTSYDVIGWLDRCTKLTLGYRQGNWWQVTWSGHQGWVSARYITSSATYYSGGGSGY